jgi:hypothetical protein
MFASTHDAQVVIALRNASITGKLGYTVLPSWK